MQRMTFLHIYYNTYFRGWLCLIGFFQVRCHFRDNTLRLETIKKEAQKVMKGQICMDKFTAPQLGKSYICPSLIFYQMRELYAGVQHKLQCT